MKLSDLEATFFRFGTEQERIPVGTLDQAHGVQLLCPKCYRTNQGRAGTHWLQLSFVGAPFNNGGQWHPVGTGLTDLTFGPPTPNSVQVRGVCNTHFHVVAGEIKDLT